MPAAVGSALRAQARKVSEGPSEETIAAAVTCGQLRALIRQEIERGIIERDAIKEPALLNQEQLGQKLQLSTRSIFELRKQRGFPELRIGDSPRFVLDDVLAWLRAQQMNDEPRNGKSRPTRGSSCRE